MSGPESRKPDDALLEEFLSGQGKVADSYRAAGQPQAPAQLDETVLKMARDAQSPAPGRRRWSLPLAAAATLLLSLGLLTRIQDDPEAMDAVFEMTAPSPAASDAPASPPPAGEPAPVTAEREAARELAKGRQRAVEPAAKRQQAIVAMTDREAPRRAPAAESPRAAPAAKEATAPAEERVTAPAEEQEEESSPPSPAAAPPAPLTRSAPAADARATPDEWLGQIRVLLDDGKTDQARQLVHAFRRDYPDHVLPEDMRFLEPGAANPEPAQESEVAPEPDVAEPSSSSDGP